MTKVVIIGAGISGLSAGIYAARSGFDVTILEQHNIPGGLSTSWSRKGYYFEGGMHWLTGSSPDMPLNRIWHETGALKDNNPIELRDPLYNLIDKNGKELKLYRFLPQMEKALMEYAPEDKTRIKKMCRAVKAFINFHMPVLDEKGCKCRTPVKINPMEFIKMLPAIIRVPGLMNTGFMEYVSKFHNENLRHLLSSVIGYRYNALSFIYTLGSFASGDCGYPAGGSIRMANNMLETYKALGGKIFFRTKAENIAGSKELAGLNLAAGSEVTAGSESAEVQESATGAGAASGIEIPADAVIITQDARAAVDCLFDTMIDEPWVNTMRHEAVTEQNIFIGLGIKADLSRLPYACVFPLNKPFEYAGCKWTELRIYNYAAYKEHAPEGCTTLTCLLIGESYGFWKAAKADGTYKAKKEELGQLFVKQLADFIPEVGSELEVIDVATPCTYERYTGSYEGSWMSVWEKGGKQRNYHQSLESVFGVYFAGQRIRMPGGLPIAVYTGRQAVQHICRDFCETFV